MNQSQSTIDLTKGTPVSSNSVEAVDPLPWLIQSLQRKLREESRAASEQESARPERR